MGSAWQQSCEEGAAARRPRDNRRQTSQDSTERRVLHEAIPYGPNPLPGFEPSVPCSSHRRPSRREHPAESGMACRRSCRDSATLEGCAARRSRPRAKHFRGQCCEINARALRARACGNDRSHLVSARANHLPTARCLFSPAAAIGSIGLGEGSDAPPPAIHSRRTPRPMGARRRGSAGRVPGGREPALPHSGSAPMPTSGGSR